MAETCRAGVFVGDGTYEVREFGVPDPPPGGAVLKVEAVGLCGSDVAQYQGVDMIPGRRVFPVVPGHETVGRVVVLGAGADLGVAEGDRVAVDELLRCGRCRGCLTGGLCHRLEVYGYTFGVDQGSGLYGGYGEYMEILPGTVLHPLSDALPAEQLTLFEPLANAVNWVSLGGVKPGDVVVVEGPGHQGLCVLEAVIASGASTVIVTGTTDDALRLEAAKAVGADHTIDVLTQDPVAVVRDLTGGRMADVVLDVVSVPQTVTLAVQLVRPRGRIVLAGLKHFEAVPGFVSDLLVLNGITLIGAPGFTVDSMRTAISLLESGRVDAATLLGEVFTLDAIDEAMDLLARRIPGRDAVRVGLVHP